ncbi:hypothetical protein J4717_13815 [Phaeobacter sp. HS012]|uniref:hypothetical protein n=1 Tax=unclassified Phaeobacter TaxID=2621772 RepID=UPI001B37C7DB|nr:MULTISPECIES: hypothetical protein [unclassified Phaeobacter]MBQ4808548.1 hypothetical protein [Phaeobacter sp. HS012]MBQ4883233.1 hypothetical protein [Phaeobacter sp. HS011]
MRSGTKPGFPVNPWLAWRPGSDRAFDALERIGVLIRSGAAWDDSYAFELGAQARRYANQCPKSFRYGLEIVLSEHGNLAAIHGWLSAAPNLDFPYFDQLPDRAE